MKQIITLMAILLVFNPLSLAQQQQQEPDSPTIAETLDYIQSHSLTTLTLNGVMLSFDYGYAHGLVNLLLVEPEFEIITNDDEVEFMRIPIDNYYQLIPQSPKKQPKYIARMTLRCTDASIAPHVAKALKHLTALVKKQNAAPVGPF